jgi:DegV family protein with EDD domain
MIKIIADSTCDLSDEVLKNYDIGVAPLTINIDAKIYRDRIDIQPAEFYEMMGALTNFPTTGMPSPVEYLKIIKQAVEEGNKEILCICMSSGTSGAYQSAVLAKDYFFEESFESKVKVHVVDSKCMSHGSGWLIMKSAMMREKGASFEEIIAFNENYKKKVKHFLSVADLDHLLKSGRLTNTSAFIGKLLMLKPIMSMKDGKGTIVGKERGLNRVLKHYTQEFIKRNDKEMTDFIIVGYTSDIKVAEKLKDKIQLDTNFMGEIHIMQMGVSVGTHVGLGAISMFFVEK